MVYGRCADGFPSAYMFGIGHVEKCIVDFDRYVEVYLEHAHYHVRSIDRRKPRNGGVIRAWTSYETKTEARKAFRRAIRLLVD